jgi:hypothetical protein
MLPNDGAMLGAAAIVSFAVWELQRGYCSMAPSLSDLRDAPIGSGEYRQKILDADMCVGGLGLIAGATASWFARSWVPLGIVAGAMLWLTYYHRAVLNGS